MEVRKDLKGYEGLYKISSNGKVMSLRKGRLLKERLTLGYNQVVLVKDGKSKQHKVHRLVLENFFGDAPEGFMCNHKNGIRNDNRIENLEWVTRSYNMLHGLYVLGHKPGKPPMGINSKCSKKVKQLGMDGCLIKLWGCMSDIERELGYDQGNISTACKKGCNMYGYKLVLA